MIVRLAAIAASVLPPPLIYRDSRTGLWHVPHGYRYVDPELGALEVLLDFTFDLASIPRPARPFISVEELSIVAPMLHDAGYRGALYPSPLSDHLETAPFLPLSLTRRQVDDLFLRVMKLEGVAKWRRGAAYYAVRTFGAGAWRAP